MGVAPVHSTAADDSPRRVKQRLSLGWEVWSPRQMRKVYYVKTNAELLSESSRLCSCESITSASSPSKECCGGGSMSVVEAALLIACGTAAAIALMFFAEAQRRRSRPRV